jgi:hypothetical protein
MSKRKLVGIIVACVIVVVVVVLVVGRTPTEEDRPVAFADANLESLVREGIDMPEGPIYPSDLQGLTNLGCYRGVTDLTGLEYCTNLTRFSDTVCQISDISPLANLTILRRLSLSDNQISDISPLVDNEGLSEGDLVVLAGNPLSCDSINTYIPQLEARGVIVNH